MSLKDTQEEKKGQKLNDTILLWETKTRNLQAKIAKDENEKRISKKIPDQEGRMIKSIVKIS